jgi:CRISPR type III-A-associated protein Csm2
MSPQGGGGNGGGGAPPRPAATSGPPFFDPAKSEVLLLDELAEKQAQALVGLNPTQLRRFFREVKEHSRRLEALTANLSEEDPQEIYARDIEPLFKMMRSKVAYATRPGASSGVTPNFKNFLDHGIQNVRNLQEFRLFVQHFEAVVGFFYGQLNTNARGDR